MVKKKDKEPKSDTTSCIYSYREEASYIEEIKKKDEEILKLKGEIYDLERREE